MGLESSGGVLSGLDEDWPLSTDSKTKGDDHIRLIKDTLKTQFPGSGGVGFSIPIIATETEINYLDGITYNISTKFTTVENDITTLESDKADVAGDTFTGSVLCTVTPPTNAAELTRKDYVDGEVTTLESSIALKADIASPTLTGVPAAPTAVVDTNTTQLATTAFVQAQLVAEGHQPDASTVGNTEIKKSFSSATPFSLSIGANSGALVPEGVHMMMVVDSGTSPDVYLQLYSDSGADWLTFANNHNFGGGLVVSDGSNVRLYNEDSLSCNVDYFTLA